MIEKDTYNTITKATEPVIHKDKNSKFFGYAFPVTQEEDIKLHLEALKKEHHSARHWCYAYQIGTETISYRANDDGEPSNSAGMPIYGQIQSYDLTNILIVVVRYFGGVKLGVGGLISAYRTAAQLSLDASNIIEKTINIDYLITFDYKNMNTVMRVIKEKSLNIINQKLELDCNITISVRKSEAQSIHAIFDRLYEIKIKKL
ncbi:YigZ family protein [Algibacter amylolyticus]|uniref:YigZ family protein n=1 Tax=Algibacter amylolyticus TaxID=1608400 RepID=A0A5M7B5W4_9FLAO|nr:YigZ family protein [Algibacter amylolyticus]KAA5824749.1 YigZ family protein [Algibacter amylolyticus]MBB5268862.1 putative YigZ family protein [Algibacter amylolyticus]TSJ75914.1 YigZ family protein [Algibacter amylolyticus]